MARVPGQRDPGLLTRHLPFLLDRPESLPRLGTQETIDQTGLHAEPLLQDLDLQR
jgi:hypothetical protein